MIGQCWQSTVGCTREQRSGSPLVTLVNLKRKLIWVAALCVLALLPSTLRAAITESEVLLVVNTNSQDSVTIASVYTNLHPTVHRVNLNVSETVNISRANFNTQIRDPIRTFLTNNNLSTTVISIVLTKGLPYKVDAIGPNNSFNSGLQNSACVDSELTMLWQNLSGSDTDTGSFVTNLLQGLAQNYVVNPFYNTNQSISSFSRASILSGKSFSTPDTIAGAGIMANPSAVGAARFTPGDMCLVNRLSGFSVTDVTNSLVRSQDIVIDINSVTVVLDRDANNWDGNTNARPFSPSPDFANTRDALTNQGFGVIFENTDAYVTNAPRPVIAYAGYGNNAHVPMPTLYIQDLLQFTYAPGAMFNTYESFNGSDFQNPVRGSGQGMISDFILKGGSLGVAHVSEPFTFAVADNQIMYVRMITGGVTWAEAAWAAIPILSWQNIVIGDPLATITVVATNAPPSLSVLRPSSINFGDVAVNATNSASFTVENVGNGTLSGTATVQNAGPFSVAGGSPFSLSVGQTTNVVISFVPTTTGAVTNKIIFTSNGGAATNTVIGTGDQAPIITSTPVTNVFLGAAYSYTVTATGFPTPAFSLTTAPTGMTINASSGLISWTPTAAQLGSNAVSVTATNGVNPNAVQTFTVTVIDNISPTLAIAQPTDFQTFTNSPITVSGTASDASGIGSVTVNGSAATVVGTNWNRSVSLVTGTNLFTVIATDASPSANATTGSVHAIYLPVPTSFALVSPANNASNVVFNPILIWAASSTDATYSVVVDTTTNFASPVFSQSGLAATNTTVTNTLSTSTAYFWKVTATTAGGSLVATNAPFRFDTLPAAPVANFTAGPTSGTIPLTVNFTNTSTGVITSQSWNFGDGGTNNTSSPSHTYTNASSFTVSLTVFGPGGTNTLTQPNFINTTNIPPAQFSVAPASLAFGSVNVGQSNTLPYQVINTGGLSLTGTASVSGPFAVSSGSSYIVGAGQTGTVSVSFLPVSTGAFSNGVVFASNGGGSTNAVTGTGVTPAQMGISPSSLNFGTISTGTTAQLSFAVTNTGSLTLSGTASVSGVTFAIASGSPVAIAGFGSTIVVVSFSPATAGSFSNGVVFASNGGNSTNTVTGTGAIVPLASFRTDVTNGLAPLTVTFTDTSTGTITSRNWNFGDGATTNIVSTNVVHIYSAGTNTVTLIASGPLGASTNQQINFIVATNIPPAQLSVAPGSIDFGSLTVGQSNTQQFIVVNGGGITLTGTASVAGPFSVSSGTPYIVGSGQTGVVNVGFIPVSAGAFSNSVIFASNGGGSTNAVTGAGITPAQMGISPSALNFGVVLTGTTAQASFVITNTGSLALNGTASMSNDTFAIVSGTPFTLAGFGSTNLVLSFTSPAVGAFSNSVVFASNGGDSTNAVIGAGGTLPIASFASDKTNGLAPLSVTFTDTSTGTITNRNWNFGDGATTNIVTTNIVHTYSSVGTNTVTLITSGPLGASTNQQIGFIIVTNIPARMSVAPSNLNFGLTAIGQTNHLSFSVINLGQAALIGTASVGGPFAVSNASFTVAGSQTGIVTVSFAPTSAGLFTNSVLFSSNGGNSTNAVSGIGFIVGQIAVTPVSLDFGSIVTGTTAQTTFVVTNTGASSVSGTATVSVAQFSIVSGSPFNLTAFGSTNVVVSFTPPTENTFTDNAVFTSTAGSSTNPITGKGASVPVAVFTGSPTNGIAAFTVTFTDTSTGTITNRFWNFGDGANTNTTATSIDHLYGVGGTFNVSLTASGPVGASTTNRANYITAYALPGASFTASPTNGVRPLAVSFVNTSTGTVSSVAWTFGDGGSSTNINPSHIYTNIGIYDVTLTVSGVAGGSTNARTAFITVIDDILPPFLRINSPTNSQVFSNATVSVTGTATDDSGIKNVKVNGTAATLIGTNWTRSVTLLEGTNTLTVTATDNSAGANAATQTVDAIFVPNPAPPPDTNAPTIHITVPTNLFQSTSRFINVLGNAGDDTGVTSVLVTNNRTASTTTASLVGTNWTALNVLLRLGTNQITATASDGTNTASAAVLVVRTSTNYVDTTLRTTKVSLTLGATTNEDSIAVSGVFNDTFFLFDPTNDIVEVMFGDYEALITSNSLSNLKYKAKASPTNTLTSLQFTLKKRSFSFAATGFTLTNGSPFEIAIGLGTNDLGPDSIGIAASANGIGTYKWAYGKNPSVIDQFFLAKSKLTLDSFSLSGTVAILVQTDPRNESVLLGIAAFEENLPTTNGWVKGTGNVYEYKIPDGHNGVVQSMTIDYDKGVWKAVGTGADLSTLTTNAPVEFRLEIGNFGAAYPAKLIQMGTGFSY